MKEKPSSKVILSPVNFKANAQSRGFTYTIDTAKEKGGGGTGPTPVEYFLSAIGGCVAITLRTYADKMEWDLGEITVNVTEDTKLTKQGIVKTIHEEILVEKNISDKQLEALKEKAKSCPVAQMVKMPTDIIRTIKN
jgi:putative redox protein